MSHDRTGLDWSLLRSFLEVAEQGSLSSAARSLGQTQPTLGRQIRALEEEVGASLFKRHARGLVLTEQGLSLLPAAREMKAAAARLALCVEGQSESLAGTVRVTASNVVAHFLLPRLIARLREEEPGIEVELVPDDSTENLLYREADIAVRMYRPTQLDLVATHVGDEPLGLYASDDYVERFGAPQGPDELAAHAFVGFDRNPQIIDVMRAMGFGVERHDFKVRCDNQVTYWELGRAGCGIVATQCVIGDADPSMKRVLKDLPLGVLPFWVVAPEALRTSARIRRVYNFLVEGLREVLGDRPKT